ncbi:hypothetical protein U9M48_024677 [Paspalum notatum var. saurae]|uniref:Integrase catalytic domain-containing protein n=1 Tax=Paspalum notatum var. saurae TaxID=547442 RepID=A0AAQ3TRT4_PASNO
MAWCSTTTSYIYRQALTSYRPCQENSASLPQGFPHSAAMTYDPGFCAPLPRLPAQQDRPSHPAGLLLPLPVPSVVWSDISMDFIESLPKVGGKSVILTVADRFSKYAHFIALAHLYSADARVFFSEIVRLHEIPTSIVSDRDPVFTSVFWKELFTLMGTKLHMSSTFHPQSDGQTEAVNKAIGMYLCCLMGDRPRQWLRWLPWAEFVYNTAFHSSLKDTPFRVVYGRDPPAVRSYDPGEGRVQAVAKSMAERDELLEDARARLSQAQEVTKRAYDRSHRDVSFAVGDWVWLAPASLPQHVKGKLRPRFYGPYRVLAVVNNFVGTPPASPPPMHFSAALPTPERVIKIRMARGVRQVLIQWKDQPASAATWEDVEEFQRHYPSWQLADDLNKSPSLLSPLIDGPAITTICAARVLCLPLYLFHPNAVIVSILTMFDLLCMKDFLFETSKLDILRPKYEANLKISSSDNEFSGICPCKVKPGLPSTININMSSEGNLIPGTLIDNVLLEVFDQFGNHVEEGTKLNVHVDGMCFLDSKSSVQKVPESCLAGSFLENIIFEISDCDGRIDESIDGPLHTLNITSNELPLMEGAQYAIKNGRCVLSRVQLPHEQGTVTICASHTHYPNLQMMIQLQVESCDLELMSLEDGSEPIFSYPISYVESSNLLLPSPGQPSHLITYVKDVVKKTKNKVGDTYSKIVSVQKTLESIYSRESLLEEEVDTLKEKIGTAAYVVCSNRHCFMDDVVGVVALLGTVPDRKIGRMLAVYLGKDDMLSVVCKTLDAAMYIEKYNTDGDVDVGYGIHYKAAALGVQIKSRFSIICLDTIEPYNGGVLQNSPQKELDLPWPYPHVKKPKEFKGFAVNMINLSDDNLNVTTDSGHGLRETLFYSLFGELQVYETRNDMYQAMNYLNNGAISLDGGVIKGKGKLLLGYSDPKITFPVVSGSPKTPEDLKANQDIVMKTRELDGKMKLLETIKTMKMEQEKVHEELLNKFNKRKRKFDEMSEMINQPCGNELALRTLGKTETLDL